MSEQDRDSKKLQRQSSINPTESRQDKLNSIEALYRAQIRQIYSDSKEKINLAEAQKKSQYVQTPKNNDPKISFTSNGFKSQIQGGNELSRVKSLNVFNTQIPSTSRTFINNKQTQEKVRASVLLKGQSTRTIQILRKQNQFKQIKIRQLTGKCQNLIQKLRKHLSSEELQIQLQNIKETSDIKTERLQKLLKIKNQQIFFKTKLQIIGLLQQFGFKKQDLSEINEITNQTNLFSFMSRKLKDRLKDFRSKQQESSFQIQKDRVMNQKQQQRIHFLTQTNELLKLSESKSKIKIEDLKIQLKEYIQRLKMKQQEKETIQNQVFKLTRQNEELNIVNQKLNNALKGVNGDKVDEKRVWQAKEKQLKLLLSNYNLQMTKMQSQLEQKEEEIQEILIRQNFLQQENQRLNRQLVRWKQRYEWSEQDKQVKMREIQQEKHNIISNFQSYKHENNQGIILGHRTQLDEAQRKIKQLQKDYEQALYQIDIEKRLYERKQEDNEQKVFNMERQWLNKFKSLQRSKEQQLSDIRTDHENRVAQLRQYYQKKQQLLAEEIQGRMKALLAEKDKKITEQFISLQNENDNLRQQIQVLNKSLAIKDSLLSVIQSNSSIFEK